MAEMPKVARQDRYKPRLCERLVQAKAAREKNQAKRRGTRVPAPPPRAQTLCPTEEVERRILISGVRSNTTTANTATNLWSYWASEQYTQEISLTWDTWTTGSTLTTNSNTGTTVGLWDTWVSIGDQYAPRRNTLNRQLVEREQTPEQKAQYEALRLRQAADAARWREEDRARANKAKDAAARAMTLLVSMLTDEQKSDLANNKFFYVNAPSGRLYRIDHGMHGNVKVVDRTTRRVIERLCIQPNGVPAADANLMQKLLIETNEEAFRAHANITLADGMLIQGKKENLDGSMLAKVIPIRRAV